MNILFKYVLYFFKVTLIFLVLHTHLFPRAISEIIDRHNVRELQLSLTTGLWRYESWGYPVLDAAPGAEVWAWFNSNTEDVDKNWRQLANSLSGLICASLNFVDDSTTINPKISFHPSGAVKDQLVNSSYIRYAALPREIVCTENLTPWKKLLPCDSKIGLASLLNAGYIHNTRYHSVLLRFRPVCEGKTCEKTSWELQQSVSLVYDYLLLGNRDWSLRKLFGQGIMGPCPLAESSTIYVDVTNSNQFDLSPQPDEYITSIRGGTENLFAKYSVKPYAMSISVIHTNKQSVVVNAPPVLYAAQYKTGYGQQKGGIVTKVYNNHWKPLDVVVLQNIPWYVPIYLHTLKIKCGENEIKPKMIKFSPGRLREKPYCLELVLTLPERSTTSISVNFDFVFLKWQEYPPDANHGFYIGSAVVSTILPLARNFTGIPQDGGTIADSFNASRSGYLVQVRTESIVITLPTPDFSMPYNVICLACTVVALAFGPLHNITTKRLKLKARGNDQLLTKIKNKIISFIKPKNKEVAEESTKQPDVSEK